MINYRLKKSKKEGKRIKVGVVGAGRMGNGPSLEPCPPVFGSEIGIGEIITCPAG